MALPRSRPLLYHVYTTPGEANITSALVTAAIRDTNIIKMVGCWRSDAMFRYLHLQAFPLMRSLAPLMLQGGSFTLPPGHDLPINAAALLGSVREAATAIIDID
jgi:hypothetical protein